ncbi:aminoacyl-tRNA deacylase [Synergistales bacterium]|nr:aminoacyl-tRNA deacylase [Synergistales bacterium]GHV52651.1 aminoacyl-tRNA deacylase [Synergistales bacterium]
MAKDAKKTNAARVLDALGIHYELVRFDAEESDLSAETAADAVGMPYEQMYKTLVLRGDKTGVMEICLPAGRELDLKAAAQASGNKSVSLVPLKEVQPLTGYIRGGCSPLGGKKSYPVYIFDDVTNHERIAISAGARGLMFILDPRDLLKATKAVPAKIAK